MNHEGFGVKAGVTVSAKALRWDREESRERKRERGKEKQKVKSENLGADELM